MFQSEGLLPGGGLFIERIPLGVTVRRIQFIDDDSVSTGGRCLYAVLVSREVEADMSHLNDDGMTPEERERIEQEKEAAKIKRQVEADLGGFDVEQEWVEEIERENCFQIDKDMGGAPPVPQSAYALWIVDAANRWVVVDSYELGEFEHGMTMSVMSLTDVSEILCRPTDYSLFLADRTISSYFIILCIRIVPGGAR
jgi:cleavage and polyadenylation specificity factor subunit 1